MRTTAPSPVTVYLGLGSNLGARATLLQSAVAALVAGGVLRGERLSPLYETDADSPDPQPPYVNAVIRGDTELDPEALLRACMRIETALGRVRPAGQTRAPRTIDIDLLLYGGEVIRTATLTVPHPALLDRAFVLVPLADVAAPGLVHPVTGQRLTIAHTFPGVRALSPG